jgi:hypothetical protein
MNDDDDDPTDLFIYLFPLQKEKPTMVYREGEGERKRFRGFQKKVLKCILN